MALVAVVSDTTCNLTPNLVEQYGVKLVSLYVNFGSERAVRESEILPDLTSFYEELRSVDVWPTTSQPSVGDFIEVYEPLLAEGRDVVSIHLPAALPSGTVGAARQAGEALEREGKGGERVHVVDSETAAGGLGLMVLVAAKKAASGADVESVLETAQEMRSSLRMWFALDTLEFLKRGGRIGAARAWIGSTLKIKPILTVQAEIAPVERVRTSARAFERMVEYAEELHSSGADAWVVQHIQVPDQADRLVERCREVFGRDPVFTSEIGPVLAVHTGPGLLGVGGVPERYV